MSISQFLNLDEEEVYDVDEIIVDDIVGAYSTVERAYETDEEDVPECRIPLIEALMPLQTIRLYEEQQENGNAELISRTNRHERVMGQRIEQRLKQTTIGSYFR